MNGEVVSRIRALIGRLGIWAAFLAVFASLALADGNCEATVNRPIAVCFAEKPLTVDHCNRTLVPHFTVQRFHSDQVGPPSYYFTYQLLLNGNPLSEPVDAFQSKPVLTTDDPAGQVPLSIDFHGTGSYAIRITVHAESQPPVTEISPPINLEDHAQVWALVVGISHYSNPSHVALDDLFHADSDAQSVRDLLKTYLPSDAHIDLRTSRDGPQGLTSGAILGSIDQIGRTESLCGDDDMFIFYFSGHGIVGASRQGSPGQVFGHYLSTEDFDPQKLQTTSINIVDLLTRLYLLRAKNLLVILDSCFSGVYRRPIPQQSAANGKGPKAVRRRSAKVEYVVNGALVDPLEIGTGDMAKQDADVMAFQMYAQMTEKSGFRALYLSAAGADHEAEEGFVSYDGDGLEFIRSDEETDEQKQRGHGLYTYSLIWNLLQQIPSGEAIPSSVLGAVPDHTTARGRCELDFFSAYTNATADINRLRKRSPERDVQTPNVAGRTEQELPAVVCAARAGGATDVRH